MPPAKKRPRGGPISPVTYANDYESPRAGAEASPDIKAQLTEQWVSKRALIKLATNNGNGQWLLARGVSETRANSSEFKINFASHPTLGRVAASLTQSQMSDDDARARLCQKIIFGFIGGTFSERNTMGDKGMKARVSGVEASGNQVAVVAFDLLAPGGAVIGQAKQPVAEFIERFPPAATPQEAPQEESKGFDVSSYPHLMRVLRVAKAIDESGSTQLEISEVAEFIGNALDKQVDGTLAAVTEAATSFEVAIEKESQSPHLTKLASTADLGLLAGAPMAKRAKIVRALVLTESPPAAGGGSSTALAASPAAAPRDDNASAGQMQPQGAATSRSKGGSAAQQHGAATPAQPVGQRAAAGKKRAAQQQPAAQADEDDSDSGSEVDDDEDDGSAPAVLNETEAPVRKQPRQANRVSFADAAATSSGEVSEVPRLIDLISTSGARGTQFLAPLDAAAIVFEQKIVRDIARCEPVPSARSLRLEDRYDLALQRLRKAFDVVQLPHGFTDVFSDSFLTKHVNSERMLETWAERLADFAAEGLVAPPAAGGTRVVDQREVRASGGGQLAMRVDADVKESSGKPDAGLSAQKAANAVPPEVAERLHLGVAQAAARWPKHGGVAACISETPSELRADLQRALLSNGQVHAPGEVASNRRALPALVNTQRQHLVSAIEEAIRAVPRSDPTMALAMEREVITELAAKVVEGSATWSSFDDAAKHMYKSQASIEGTYARVHETWSIAGPALHALTSTAAIDSAGLATLSAQLSAQETLSRLSAADKATWAARVIGEWREQLAAFRSCSRQHSQERYPPPSFAAAVGRMDQWFTTHALARDIKRQQEAERPSPAKPPSQQPRQQQRGSPKSPKSPAAASPAAAPGAPQPGGPAHVPKEKLTAWPEKTAQIPKEVYAALRKAAEQKYPDVCSFFITSRCSKGNKCKHKHERPADFAAFLDAQGLKIDGSAKCAPQPRHATQHMHDACAAPAKTPAPAPARGHTHAHARASEHAEVARSDLREQSPPRAIPNSSRRELQQLPEEADAEMTEEAQAESRPRHPVEATSSQLTSSLAAGGDPPGGVADAHRGASREVRSAAERPPPSLPRHRADALSRGAAGGERRAQSFTS